jgi:hypothetical protein
MMNFIFFTFTALALAAAAVAFLSFSDRHRKKLFIGAVLSLVPIMVKMLFSFFPLLEARIMPVKFYPLIQMEFWLPFPVLFFAFASHLVTVRNRSAALIVVGVMVAVVIQQTFWHLSKPDIYAYKGKIVEGVCHQTSPETCGAASMVTLLKAIGIRATEGEMARLSMTAPRAGLTPHQAAYGLKRKFGQLGRTDKVADLPGPFLAGIRFSTLENHMICVLETARDALVVGDPLSFGPKTWSWEDFEKKWSGVVIVSQ